MSATHHRWRSAATGALALLMGLAGVSSAAAADPIGPGNIDTSRAVSLTIHKYAGTQGDEGDGTQLADTSKLGKPLAGVIFQAAPVTAKGSAAIDLTTDAGWDVIKGATAAQVAGSGWTKGTPVTAMTDADGVAVPTGLKQGLYLVTETGTGSNPVVSRAEPFLVTLPLPQTKGNWLYDVHVYPKNQVADSPVKAVSDSAKPVLGSTVPWTITQTVPPLNQGDTYRSFVITDTLDPRLGYTSAAITTDGFTADDYTVATSGQKVTLTLTASGLAKLEAGQVITVDLVTKVNSLGDDGTIENTAVTTINGTDLETNTVSTNWGPLQILKHATGDESKTLKGAEFEVYSDAAAKAVVQKLTTDEKGLASVSLWVGNNDVTSRDYWVKETKAPAGYLLDSTLRKVSVKAAASTSPVVLKVADPQQGHPALPLTGGEGRAAMLGLAGLLLAVAVAVGTVSARRRTAVK
jgi:fimbrial isopeptide formation D2 family protein